jgi:hypothetical protein
MPDEQALINNPQAIAFVNGQLRPLAKRFADLYHEAKRVQAVYDALGLGAIIPAKDDIVADGAVSDGRPIVTGLNVSAFLQGLAQYTSTIEQNDSYLLKKVLQIAPNQ